MSSKKNGVATRAGVHVWPAEKTAGDEGPLLFVPVQPQASRAASRPMRTMVKRHIAVQSLCNMHSCQERDTLAPPKQAQMKEQLSRFRLDQNNRASQKRRPIAIKVANQPRSTQDAEARPGPRVWEQFLPVQDVLSTYRRDPFTILPIEDTEEARSLFTFYLHDLNNKSVSQNPQQNFIPIALSDAACFHVLMATVVQVQRFLDRPGGDCFWFYRGGAIAALNKALANAETHITDAMFCAVAMLAYIESRVPSLRAQSAGLHVAALVKFLELRKGILSLELYGMLLRLSIWCDIDPPLSVPSEIRTNPDTVPRSDAGQACKEKVYMTFSSDLFDHLRELVAMRDEFGCDLSSPTQNVRRSLAYERFVTRLLRRTSRTLSQSPTVLTAQSNMTRAVRLGQILFLYTISPAMSVSGVYSQTIAAVLRDCLLQCYTRLNSWLRWEPEVLCWLLFNGAITKQTNPVQNWYFRCIIEFLHSQRITNFCQVEELMRKVCWIEDMFGTACRLLFRHLLPTVELAAYMNR